MKGTGFWLKIRCENPKVFYLSPSLLQVAWVTLWRPLNCSAPLWKGSSSPLYFMKPVVRWRHFFQMFVHHLGLLVWKGRLYRKPDWFSVAEVFCVIIWPWCFPCKDKGLQSRQMFQHVLLCNSVGVFTCSWLMLVTCENTSLWGAIGSELSSPPTGFLLVFILAAARSPSLRFLLGVSKRLLSLSVGMKFSGDSEPKPLCRCYGMPSWAACILHIPLLPVSRETVFKLVE